MPPRSKYDVERLEKVIGQLDEQVAQMLAEAAGQDAAEDAAERTIRFRVGRGAGTARNGWRS